MANIRPDLAAMTARPPTPPKENFGLAAKMAFENGQLSYPAHESLLNTPEESPSSSAEYFGGFSDKNSKRVGFSPWTQYHKPPSNSGLNGSLNDQIRILPPSRECRSSKSILKSKPEYYSFTPMEDLLTLSVDGNLSSMLETTTRHLESSFRNSRLDAYSTLIGCLSAYDNVPGQEDLAGKLFDFLRFIKRDIWAKQEDNGLLDTQLATQALKLFVYFVTTPSLSKLLPDEFCLLVLEESIKTLENQAMPKILVSHYMQLLIQDHFASQHLNSNRINRLLVAMSRIATNIKGNRIVGQRLMLYRRLLSHSKSAMILHVETWIDHLISGILSTFKEIRCRAVFFGNEASLSLGSIKSVSQTFTDTLNRESPEGRKVVDFLVTRLTAMANVADDGIWVPQIWSIVILFLRGQRHGFERWEHFKPWLLLIQKCFNSSDAQIKFQSNRAWSRLIFAVNLDSSTSSKMVKMLRQPILPQLERKHNLKGSQMAKSPKQVARSSYCTLLYYAFRPSATHAQLDHYWEEYVRQMLPKNLSRSKDDVNFFCQVLASLFNSAEPKTWDENRANINRQVKVDELPCVDSKWVRLRAAEILMVFEDLFNGADWKLGNQAVAPIILAWRSFTNAIRQAGSKEVKTSMETMTALAHILTSIKRFWQHGLNQRLSQGVSPLIQKFDRLVREAVSQFGLIPFNEKRLAQTKFHSYEAAETPSARGDQHQGPLNSPVLVLFGLLLRSIDYQEIEDSYRDAVKNLIDVATRSSTSRRTQLAIFRDLATVTASEHDTSVDARLVVWGIIAEATTRAFEVEKICDLHVDSPQYPGHEYRDAARILESAISLRPQKAMTEWQDLGTTIVHTLRKEIGSDAVILIMTEPLAKAIVNWPHSGCNDFLLSVAHFLLNTIQWPQSRPAIDRARKLLWGMTSITPKTHVFDPLDHLYTMTNLLLKSSYSEWNLDLSSQTCKFLLAVAAVIAECPTSLTATVFKNIQEGLGFWIQDPNGVLTASVARKGCEDVRSAVTNLWAAISTTVEGLPKIDSEILSIVGPLIVSSLKSRHKAILNDSILLWNRTFGNVEGLDYPDTLRPVLLRLRTLANLELPNFKAEDDNDVISSPVSFLDSEIDEDVQTPHFSAPLGPASKTTAGELFFGRSLLAAPDVGKSPLLHAEDQGPKMTPQARLRHDDSQILFAAIDSSPLQPDEVESQMLTDRQKEVRQRQGFEATTMFPNLGLLPKPKDRISKTAIPRLHIAENGMSSSPIDIGSDSVISPYDTLNDVIGSSPTPRSSNGNSQHLTAIQQSSSHKDVSQPVTSFDVRMASWLDETAELEAGTAGKEEDVVASDQGTQTWEHGNFAFGSQYPDNRLDSFEALVNQLSTPEGKPFSVNETVAEGVDVLPMSDSEVFVDAQPEPPSPSDIKVHIQVSDVVHASDVPPQAMKLPNEVATGGTIQEPVTPSTHSEVLHRFQVTDVPNQASGTSQIIDSFEDAETHQTPNEDDQIAAQLVQDLERASSQAEGETAGDAPYVTCPRVSNAKRKSAPEGAETVSKKARIQQSRTLQNFHIVVDSRPSSKADHEHSTMGVDVPPRPSPRNAKLGKIGSRSKSLTVKPKRTSPRNGAGRHARSSSTGVSSEHESCGASDETRLSAIDTKHELAGHLPVGRRRRSARLNRLLTATQPQDLRGSDAASTSSDELLAAAVDADSFGKAEQSLEHSHSTERGQLGHSGEGSQEDMSSSRKTRTESAARDDGIPLNVTGFYDPPAAAPTTSHRAHDSPPTERTRWEAETPTGDVSRLNGSLGGLTVLGHAATTEEAPAGDGLGAQGILRSFRNLLENIKRVTLGAEEERELVSVLVDSVREVHEAGRRHGNTNP